MARWVHADCVTYMRCETHSEGHWKATLAKGWLKLLTVPALCMQAIPSFNSKEFSGGLVSQEDIGVLFRFIHSVGGTQNPSS